MSVTKVQLVGNVFGDASFSGSVGIGTTDPTSTLTVIGEIETTNLVANGNVEFGSGVTIIGVTTSSDGFDGDLTGNADTATALSDFRDFSISGDATASSVSFNGTANVGLALTLADTAVSPGSYGSSTEVATFTVDSKGRLTAAGTAAVGTALTVTGDSGSLDINLLSETLTIAGGDNLTSIGFGNTITVNLNDDISLVNILSVGVITAVSGFVGNISGDLTGNVNAFAFDTNNDGVVVTGIATATSFSGDNLIIVNGTITNITGTAGTITTLDTTNLTGTAGTITTFNSTNGTITNLTSTNVNASGISTVGSLSIGSTQVISSARELQNIVSLDATTTATIESAIASGPNTFTDLTVTGISTFTNGPVMVGSGVSTGTSEQRLQVTGGAYVSGSVGIGTTNPVFKAEIAGDARITSSNKLRFGGTSGTTNFYIQYNSTTNSLDFVAG